MARQETIAARTPDQHPVTIAGYVSIGLTGVIALHATVWPQHQETDFAIYLVCVAAFVAFAIGYAAWYRFFREQGFRRRIPQPPEGPTPPAVDSLMPVPLIPRSPVRQQGATKAFPAEEASPREMVALTLESATSAEPVIPTHTTGKPRPPETAS